jgi:hypothetical protein
MTGRELIGSSQATLRHGSRVAALVLLAWLGLAAAPAHAAPSYAGAMFRYWEFTNDNDLRDYMVYWAGGPFHAVLEYWDFELGEDQFRPEFGVHLRDSRRSVYSFTWRHEGNQERFFIGTDQVLGDGPFVARAEISPIVARESTLVVVSAGLDYYWGSYNFAQITVIRDPRDGGLWVVPMRVRLANERNDWIQVGVAPASQRSIGWLAEAKVRGIRFGIERNSRYDFTSIDNVIFSIGYERVIGAP